MATINYPENSEIKLLAEPNKGYEFIHWIDDNGAIIGNNPNLTYIVERNVTIKAVFEKEDTGPNIKAQCEPKEGGTINITTTI